MNSQPPEPQADAQLATLDVARRLVAVGTAAMCDAGATPMSAEIASCWEGAQVAGPAVVAKAAPGDNLAVQVATAEAGVGSVLVIDASDGAGAAVWGEVLAVAAAQRQVVGIVVDGAVRDVDALRRRSFPAWSRAVSPVGPVKKGGGYVGGSVRVGGVDVEHGDWIVADADGVVVIAAALVNDALVVAEAKAEREVAWFERLAAGESTLDLFGLDASSVERR